MKKSKETKNMKYFAEKLPVLQLDQWREYWVIKPFSDTHVKGICVAY